MSNRKIIYYDKEKDVGLSIGYNEFRGKKYVHISINMFDPDTEAWYRTKGLSVTEDYVDFIIEGLELQKYKWEFLKRVDQYYNQLNKNV